jgi:hypothetical protein
MNPKSPISTGKSNVFKICMISFIVNDTKVDQVIYLYLIIIKIINNLPKIYLQLQNKMPINLILFDIKTILSN